MNELAATMTVGEVATQAVEAVRALSQLMATDAGKLAGAGEAREVVGPLALMGGQLPQLCEQLARFLVVQCEDGQIARGTGGDPDGVLVEVSEALSAAGRAADMMAAALAEAAPRPPPRPAVPLAGRTASRARRNPSAADAHHGGARHHPARKLTPADIGIFLALHRQVTRF